jgi:protein-S-isoprenylcysteine O-methyltransferase Ste14
MTSAAPPGPGVRYPPPLLFVLGIVAGWLLDHAVPLPLIGPAARSAGALVGWLLLALGVALAVWALATFRAAGTAISPNWPTSALVTHGPFRHSRNPMYLALSLLYLGVMLLVNSVWTLLLLPFVIATLHLTVIRREERYLAAIFGISYDEYRRRVRRWL